MKKRRLTTTAVLATLLTSTVAPSVTQAAKVSEEQKEQVSSSADETPTSDDKKEENSEQAKNENKDVQETTASSAKEETSTTTSSTSESTTTSTTEAKPEVAATSTSTTKDVVKEASTSQTDNETVKSEDSSDSTDNMNNSDVKVANVTTDTENGQTSESTTVEQPQQEQQATSSDESSQNNQSNSQSSGQNTNNSTSNSGQEQQSNGQVSKPQQNTTRPTTSSRPVTSYNNGKTSNSTTPSPSIVTNAADLLPGTPVHVTATMTGQEFVEAVGAYAAEVAAKNDLYASVMIAQAALETGFGSSTLSQEPNYNFFGIKGSYNGSSVNMATQEDGASGLYTINDNFRKYPSPKESFEDYAELMHQDMYKGVLKSNTKSYQDATAFLTGRYATDHQYAEKLNAIIEAYDLTKYDNLDGSASEQLEKVKKEEAIFYDIKLGDTLSKIAAEYETTVEELRKENEDQIKDVNLIYSGQKLKVGTKVTYEYKYNSTFSNSDDNNVQAKQGDFSLPLKPNSYTVTSPFGARSGEIHQGIDLATPVNSSVYAARDGQVAAVGYHPSAGNYVIIKHADHVYTNYFHLTSQAVKVGETVKSGQLIAKSGNTGNSTGPHLHFGISSDLWSGYTDPTHYLQF